MLEGCNSSYNPFTLSEKSKMRYNLRTNVDFKGHFKGHELIILPGHVYVENKLIYVKKVIFDKKWSYNPIAPSPQDTLSIYILISLKMNITAVV